MEITTQEHCPSCNIYAVKNNLFDWHFELNAFNTHLKSSNTSRL